jgi:hypothetical protein
LYAGSSPLRGFFGFVGAICRQSASAWTREECAPFADARFCGITFSWAQRKLGSS